MSFTSSTEFKFIFRATDFQPNHNDHPLIKQILTVSILHKLLNLTDANITELNIIKRLTFPITSQTDVRSFLCSFSVELKSVLPHHEMKSLLELDDEVNVAGPNTPMNQHHGDRYELTDISFQSNTLSNHNGRDDSNHAAINGIIDSFHAVIETGEMETMIRLLSRQFHFIPFYGIRVVSTNSRCNPLEPSSNPTITPSRMQHTSTLAPSCKPTHTQPTSSLQPTLNSTHASSTFKPSCRPTAPPTAATSKPSLQPTSQSNPITSSPIFTSLPSPDPTRQLLTPTPTQTPTEGLSTLPSYSTPSPTTLPYKVKSNRPSLKVSDSTTYPTSNTSADYAELNLTVIYTCIITNLTSSQTTSSDLILMLTPVIRYAINATSIIVISASLTTATMHSSSIYELIAEKSSEQQAILYQLSFRFNFNMKGVEADSGDLVPAALDHSIILQLFENDIRARSRQLKLQMFYWARICTLKNLAECSSVKYSENSYRTHAVCDLREERWNQYFDARLSSGRRSHSFDSKKVNFAWFYRRILTKILS
jgi:hypothetical protein